MNFKKLIKIEEKLDFFLFFQEDNKIENLQKIFGNNCDALDVVLSVLLPCCGWFSNYYYWLMLLEM